MYIFFKLSEPQEKLANMLKILEIPKVLIAKNVNLHTVYTNNILIKKFRHFLVGLNFLVGAFCHKNNEKNLE